MFNDSLIGTADCRLCHYVTNTIHPFKVFLRLHKFVFMPMYECARVEG